jgi:hypothetical protein
MNLFVMGFRTCDPKGCGHFGASRGSRKHVGVDMACAPGTDVGSPVRGVVTKLGWPYRGHPEVRYVEVEAEEYLFRMFYVDPSVKVGDVVELNGVLGTSQALGHLYPGITEHVHFEIKDKDGKYVDPTPVIVALRGTLKVDL